MKSILITILSLMALSIAYPYGRSGDLADPSFLTTGDQAICFSVSVDTSTPVLVYDSNSTGKWDREVLLQNTSSTYDIYCSTSGTGFTATSGPRFLLPKNPSGFTTNNRGDIWCLVESGAGSTTIDVVGIIEYSLKD
jgi:hypothetical protein